MIRRLRGKFVVINMALVLAVLLAVFALVFDITRRDLEDESIRMLESVAEDPFRIFQPGDEYQEVQIPYFVIQMNTSGKLMAVGGYFDLTDEETLWELLEAAREDGRETGVLSEYGFRYCVGHSRFGECVVFADMSSERATLSGLVRTCLIIGAVSAGVFLVISFFLARWAVRPVERAWEQQRQFVADASHELKTPLTVIMTNAELLSSPTADGEAKARYAGNILAMSRQMRGLVQGLLELARVENGAVKRSMGPVDLTALTVEAVLPFEPMFFEHGLELVTEAAPGIFVRGSGEHLRQVLEVLLDNALKYSSSPGRVTVTLRRQGRHAVLEVASPGENMSREELTDIFKRFYRADRARQMNSSYGLGLPIAAGIVEEHGGRIWARSEGGVNTFFVELAAISEPSP